jgi:Ca2+-transporting ATPase
MTIIHCYLNGENFEVTGTGYEPKGEIKNANSETVNKDSLLDNKVFILDGFLASTGKINPPDKHHPSWYPVGDPTECAFSTLILKAGYTTEEIESEYKRVQLFPFDSDRKRISIVRAHNGKHISFVKGSIESVLEICTSAIVKNQIMPLTKEMVTEFLETSKIHASKAERVIALGYKDLPLKESHTIDEAEKEIVFAGFVTMIDPPHEQVKEALEMAFNAGMRVIMITGDNEITAQAVANQIAMFNKDGSLPEVINDKKLQSLDDESIKNYLKSKALIFSRVSPDEKFKIISLLEEMGDVVAVTGDGVNDTLSLKKADIGIAMGLNGSKVAQEAASMVLLNDDFSTIVQAIQEGRSIYNNLKKIVLANLIGNLAELVCVLTGFVMAFWHLLPPIYAVHILMIDLIGNMLPLLMLTFDQPEGNIMLIPPRKKGEMLDFKNLMIVLYSGIMKGAISVGVYFLSFNYHSGSPIQCQIAVTSTMCSIILCQFINIFSSRTSRTIFTSYFFSNRQLFLGIGISMLFMIFISYSPLLNKLVHTGPLSVNDWIYEVAGAGVYLLFFELIKAFQSKKQPFMKTKLLQYGS